MIIHPDGSITGTVGGGTAESVVMQEAKLVLADGRCRQLELDLAQDLGVCGGKMEVFLEPVLRESNLLIIGAGHVGRAIVDLGQHLPLRLLLVDDRAEFIPDEALPERVSARSAGPEQLAGIVQPSAGAGVVVASRNHELDGQYLEVLLQMEQEAGVEFGFLGVLGSRSKAARIRQRLAQSSPDLQERLHSVQLPVGIETGAETPHEIALSVLAEALAVLRGVKYLEDPEGRALGLRLQRRREGNLS